MEKRNRITAILLLVATIVTLSLLVIEYHDAVIHFPNISPGKGIVYEGVNPPREMLNDPNYIVTTICENGQLVYFISFKKTK